MMITARFDGPLHSALEEVPARGGTCHEKSEGGGRGGHTGPRLWLCACGSSEHGPGQCRRGWLEQGPGVESDDPGGSHRTAERGLARTRRPCTFA
jgi:hypothetical protein